MRATVLCPGPSLARIACDHAAGFIVGVNRAPFIVRDRITVDVWCFGDGGPFVRVDRDGGLFCRPMLFAAHKALVDVCNAGLADVMRDRFGPQRAWEQVGHCWPPQWGWMEYSATAAIVCAADAGATLIEVYGADWTDDPDADGVMLATNDRGGKRWRNERITWDLVVSELALKDVEVRRCFPST